MIDVPDWLELGIIIASSLGASTALIGIMPIVPSNRLSGLARWMMRVAILITITNIAAMFVFSTEGSGKGEAGNAGTGMGGGDVLDLTIMISALFLGVLFLSLLIHYIVLVTRSQPLIMDKTTVLSIYLLPVIGLSGILCLAVLDPMGWGPLPTAGIGNLIMLFEAIGGAMVLALTYRPSWSRLPEAASGTIVGAGLALASLSGFLVMGMVLANWMDAFTFPPLRPHPGIAVVGFTFALGPTIASLMITSDLARSRAFMVETPLLMKVRNRAERLGKGTMFYIDGRKESDLDMAFETVRTEARNGRPCVIITGRRLGTVRDRFQLRNVALLRAATSPVGGQLSLGELKHLEMVPIMASDFASENLNAVILIDILSEYLLAGHRKTVVRTLKRLENVARTYNSTVIVTLRTKETARVMTLVRELSSPL